MWLFYEKALILKRKQQYEDALVFAHCMTLPLGGKEAAKSFEKFLKSLLPRDAMKNIERVREYKKIESTATRIKKNQEADQQDITDYFRQTKIPIPFAPNK